MSKKESVRDGIGTARNLLLAFLTAIFGVFGYGIVHIDDLTKNQMLCGIIALCLLFVGIVLVSINYFIKIKTLEKMR